ncbi:hypothetical protein NPIL_583561 [Nephila pilipes]|uniref:Uncharacterized protein n=1 Tax=Nephila pilipes TaxID=299642 RepID=A0A8X6Q5E6_NEPPI|nr:hypothetical protein NPIL_583561 [Nephila pilipes]
MHALSKSCDTIISTFLIRCRAHGKQASFEEEDDGKKLPRCCCPLMTAFEQSEDKIPAQKVNLRRRAETEVLALPEGGLMVVLGFRTKETFQV